jgi:hypothetical protein
MKIIFYQLLYKKKEGEGKVDTILNDTMRCDAMR